MTEDEELDERSTYHVWSRQGLQLALSDWLSHLDAGETRIRIEEGDRQWRITVESLDEIDDPDLEED